MLKIKHKKGLVLINRTKKGIEYTIPLGMFGYELDELKQENKETIQKYLKS